MKSSKPNLSNAPSAAERRVPQPLHVDGKILMGLTIPRTGPELGMRIAEAIVELLEYNPDDNQSTQHARVNCIFADQTNLERIIVDLSGYGVSDSVFTSHEAPLDQEPALPAIISSEPALLARLQLRANPLTVIGIPVTFDVDARQIPIAWLTDQDRNVWLAAQEETQTSVTHPFQPLAVEHQTFDPKPFSAATAQPASSLEATFSGRVNLEVARMKLREFAIRQTKDQDIKVKDLNFDLKQSGQQFHLSVQAKLKYKLFGAKFRAAATVNFDKHNLTVTLTKFKIKSSNLVALIPLAIASKSLTKFQGRPLNINDSLLEGSEEFTALNIEITNQELRVQGRIVS